MAAARADRTSGKLHRVPERRLYRLRALQGRSARSRRCGRSRRRASSTTQTEKMIYFEDARLEFFGMPLAYLPYFSAPDPTVKRKSGFLMPMVCISTTIRLRRRDAVLLGAGARLRRHALAAHHHQAGPAAAGRMAPAADERLLLDPRQPASFSSTRTRSCAPTATPTPGYRDFRGSIETTGQFALNDKWVWGWDGIAGDRPDVLPGLRPAHLSARRPTSSSDGLTEGVSQLYLAGRGDRSYFDMRAMYFYGFSEADVQSQIPIIHPVIDYSYVFGQPVFGGELSYRANLTSLSATAPTSIRSPQTAFNNGLCAIADRRSGAQDAGQLPAARRSGHLHRASPARRPGGAASSIPSARSGRRSSSLRADVAALSVKQRCRASPTIFRPATAPSWPRHADGRPRIPLSVHQRAVLGHADDRADRAAHRAAERDRSIGKLPNEDAQSLIFDDSNLFKVDKFSGWDRVEGGGRANAGIQYTAQFNRGGFSTRCSASPTSCSA